MSVLLTVMALESIAVVVLLVSLASARAQIARLKEDNGELLRRLRVLSRSKIVD